MPSRRRRKKIIRWTSAVIITALLIIAVWFGYHWYLYRKAKFTRYPEFGIAIPNDYIYSWH